LVGSSPTAFHANDHGFLERQLNFSLERISSYEGHSKQILLVCRVTAATLVDVGTGGALAVIDECANGNCPAANANIQNSNFTSNFAFQAGGALYYAGSNPGDPWLAAEGQDLSFPDSGDLGNLFSTTISVSHAGSSKLCDLPARVQIPGCGYRMSFSSFLNGESQYADNLQRNFLRGC